MANQEAQAYDVNRNSGGKPLRLKCPVCGHDKFWTRETLMNTAGLTFFDLDWMNRSATNFICDECGHVAWFMSR